MEKVNGGIHSEDQPRQEREEKEWRKPTVALIRVPAAAERKIEMTLNLFDVIVLYAEGPSSMAS